MRIFLKTLGIFLIFPAIIFILALLIYIKHDVYADFGNHKNYNWKYYFQQLGDISTKKLLNNSTIEYNSFVFGSSRSTSIYACYLQKKIPGSQFFHYGNWNETVGGIYAKLHLIDSLGLSIDNVFIYFDTDYTFRGDGKCSPADHYLLTKNSKFSYLKRHFNSFYKNFSVDKLRIILGLKVEGKVYPNKLSDVHTNDYNHICSPEIIDGYGDVNTSQVFIQKIDSLKASGFLYTRSDSVIYNEKMISDTEALVLKKMLSIFKKHNTNYTIVITPVYDQHKFNAEDSVLLYSLFGENIHDFSGINKITQNEYNYPDRKHFQPYITKMIIDSVIKNN
jgi:hypothetical protein